jgi:parallel beta-helix repeat protein
MGCIDPFSDGGQRQMQRFAQIMVLVMMVLVPQMGPMAPCALAGEYYVSGEGSDFNPGTLLQPWRTLAHANRALQAGDTLFIREGTYDEIIEPFHSGTPGHPIVYRNYPGEEAILRGKPNTETIVAIGYNITGSGYGKSYIVVDGLNLRGVYFDGMVGTYFPKHVLVYGFESTGNEIKNCVMSRENPVGALQELGELDYGIAISKASDTLIEGNTIDGMTRIGVVIGGTQHNILRNNVIVNCGASSIVLGSSKGIVQGTLIEGNVLGGSITEDGIQFEHDYGLEYDDGSNQGVIIRNNIIFGNAENAIDLKGASKIVIEGNTIYANRGDNEGSALDDPDRGGGFGGIMHGTGPGSKDVIIRKNVIYDNRSGVLAETGYKIYNNTVVHNNRDYTGPDSTYGRIPDPFAHDPYGQRKPAFIGVAVYNAPDRVAILNNIIGGHSIVEIVLGPGAGDGVWVDHNLYFNAPAPQFGLFRDFNDWDPIAFRVWTAYLQSLDDVVGSDRNGLVGDPLFAEASEPAIDGLPSHGFLLRQGSPAIDSGGWLTETTSSGAGAWIDVADVGFFFDGYGAVAGDTIQVEGSDETYQIQEIDGDRNALRVDRALTWQAGQGIALPYHGSRPDIGACEYQEAGSLVGP